MQSIDRPAQRAIIILIIGLLWLNASASELLAQERATGPDDSARYRVEFIASWSEATHPHPGGEFPAASAHFSPLIGAVHNSDVAFWATGELASVGIEQMAETGATGLLTGEILTAIDDGSALAVVGGAGAVSPGSTVIGEVNISAGYPLVTFVTMIAPSPDWFVGISGESLLSVDGQWASEKVLNE